MEDEPDDALFVEEVEEEVELDDPDALADEDWSEFTYGVSDDEDD